MHLLRWLLRRSLGVRFDEAAEMAARPSADWTVDERDSGLGLPAAQLRLAERVIAVRVPLLVGSVALVAAGGALG